MDATAKVKDPAQGGASGDLAEGVVLNVFEDRGVKAEEDPLEVQAVPEARSPDPLALPRPHRHERYPTEYRAPTAVLTPAERDLLLGTGAASLAPPQACAAEERPAGWMQPPQATVSLSQPPPTVLLDHRKSTVKQETPPLSTPQQQDWSAPGKKRRRTVEELCEEEEELRRSIAESRPRQQYKPPPSVDGELPSLGTYRPSGAQLQPLPEAAKPPAQQNGDSASTAYFDPGAAFARPSVSIGQHGVIARKKPRRMLDDVEDAGPCAQTSVEGSPGKAGATRPQTYQRFPGQQRDKQDGSMSRKRKAAPEAPRARTPPPPATYQPQYHHQQYAAPPQQQAPAAQAADPGVQMGGPGAGAVEGGGLSPLHTEMVKFNEVMTASPEEQQLVTICLAAVRSSVAKLWPYATTHVFGSQAVGLAMPGSDVDICVLDAIETDNTVAKTAKQMQTVSLRMLKAQLCKDRHVDLKYPVTLIGAKVPIIKCHIKCPGSSRSLKTDISLNVGNGVRAVEGVKAYMEAMPPLRPLVLAAKTLVKGHRLHEVHTGGISSFSLTNMAIAHLMAEGYHLPGQPPPQKEHAGQEVNQDLGHLLWGFLVRFGKVFDYYDQAVSITQVKEVAWRRMQGGVTRKKPEWRVKFKAYLLAIEDPNVPGHDISSGTYQIQRVQKLFAESSDELTVAVEKQMEVGQKEEAEEQLAWDRVQEEGKHRSDRPQQMFPILGSILKLD